MSLILKCLHRRTVPDADQALAGLDHCWRCEGGAPIVGTATPQPLQERLLESIHRQYTGHESAVRALAVSPIGRWFASAGDDRSVQLWRPTGPTRSFHRYQFSSPVRALSTAADGQTLAVGEETGDVSLIDISEDRLDQQFRGHDLPITSLDFSPTGQRLAISASGPEVRDWDLSTQEHRAVGRHEDGVARVGRGANGRVIVSAGWDGVINVWLTQTGKLIRTWRLPMSILGFALSADGRRAMTLGTDDAARCWDLRRGKRLATLRHPKTAPVSATLLPGNRFAVTGSDDGLVRVWDLTNEACTHVFEGHAGPITALAILPGANTILAADEAGMLVSWYLPATAMSVSEPRPAAADPQQLRRPAAIPVQHRFQLAK